MGDKIQIHEMTEIDPPIVAEAFQAQGWNKSQNQYERYYNEQVQGKRTVLIARRGRKFLGYLTIVWESHYLLFRHAGIPEIVDFNVLVAHQRIGIGTNLMDEAESRISKISIIAGVSVGLSPNYGAAQVMYAKRGYIPDGKGLQYDGKRLEFGDMTIVDHNLVMYLTKEVKNHKPA